MAENKKKSFFGRMFNRLRGKDEVPQVEAPEVSIEDVTPPVSPEPVTKKAEPKAKPAKAKAKPKTTKKSAAKAKAPAKPKAAPKTPVKKEVAETPAPKPKAKSKPKATPKPKAEPKPKAAPKKKAKAAPKPKVETPTPEPDPEAIATPEPAPVVEAEAPPPPTPEPVPTPAPEPEPVPAPDPPAPAVVETAPDPIPEPEPEAEAEASKKKKGWFARLKSGLSRSSTQLKENITAVFTKRKLDDDTLQDLEDVLIQADLGVETAMNITEALAKDRYNKEVTDHEVREILSAEVARVLAPVAQPLEISGSHKPHIILVVGVNGTGKTTTIGKFAAKFRNDGKKVMLAAGDTFRAAAIDQLKIWGERVGAPVVAGKEGADSSGLAYDAITAARDQDIDILMIDTAGRLQNQADLMAELEKLVRVIGKQDDTAPHDVLLTLDATTGQNALQQVEIFKNVAKVSGLVMTKLDGTARGGILVAISAKYALPVHAIGVGETLEDLQPFDANQFAEAIAGMDEEAA
jgi:fused signal recognition particle receptor